MKAADQKHCFPWFPTVRESANNRGELWECSPMLTRSSIASLLQCEIRTQEGAKLFSAVTPGAVPTGCMFCFLLFCFVVYQQDAMSCFRHDSVWATNIKTGKMAKV